MKMIDLKDPDDKTIWVVPTNIARIHEFLTNGDTKMTRIEFVNKEIMNSREKVDDLILRLEEL